MSLLRKAIEFATEAHDGQIRKFSNTPFIFHPFEVGQIVSNMTDDEEVIAAAVLHDTVEDTEVTMEDLEREFGTRIKDLVAMETENKRPNSSKSATWKVRKAESLEKLAKCDDIDVKKMWLADKLSNVRSCYRMYLKEGLDMWKAFNNANPSDQKWYYTTIVELLKDLSDYSIYREFAAIVDVLFKDVE